jgi:tetratricopeptide (TPR) repeat protein
MKVVDDQSSIQSWVTVVAIAALLVVGALVVKNKDRFLPAAPATPRVVKQKISEETEMKFFEARDRIVGGKYAEAAAILTAIDTDKVPQPTRNWMTLQNGLARLLDGRLPDARAEFARLEQRGPFSTDPHEEKLARFFVRVGKLGAKEDAVKGDAVADLDSDSVEAIGFLVFGLKDWALGEYDEAANLFRRFRSATPPENEIWLRRYRTLAEAQAASFAEFSIAIEAAKDTGSLERKRSVLETLASARAKVKKQPALVARLSAIEADLKAQVETVDAETRAVEMAADAADQKIIDDVKTRVAQFNAKLQFADAHQIVFTATVNGDKAKTELDHWFKRTEWLAKFKATLIDDLSAAGYAKPLTKKDGKPIPAPVKTADDTQLTTTSKAAIPWTDLTPETLAAIATDFLAAKKDPSAVTERKWLIGNFLYETGRKPAALPLLREAAAGNPEFKEALPLFPE